MQDKPFKRKDPNRVTGDLIHDPTKCLACLLGLDPDVGLAWKSGKVVYRGRGYKKEGKARRSGPG